MLNNSKIQAKINNLANSSSFLERAAKNFDNYFAKFSNNSVKKRALKNFVNNENLFARNIHKFSANNSLLHQENQKRLLALIEKKKKASMKAIAASGNSFVRKKHKERSLSNMSNFNYVLKIKTDKKKNNGFINDIKFW